MEVKFKSLVNFLKENNLLIILSFIYLIFLSLYWGHFGNPIIDCGREAFIPYDMVVNNKALFKDIICIYGPLPYLLNALFMKIFSVKLFTLYSVGAVLSYVFILFLYLIAKEFLSKLTSFLFVLFVLFSCIFSIWIFNYIFPYSYATVYAVTFLAAYIYFQIKYIKTSNPSFLYWAGFVFSIAILSKYDFALVALSLVAVLFLKRNELKFKNILLLLCSFSIPVILVASVLMLQKVSLNDLFLNFKIISNMASSHSLKVFYSHSTGLNFNISNFKNILPNFLKYFSAATAFFGLSFLFSKIEKKAIKFSLLSICLVSFTIFFLLKNGSLDLIFTYITLFIACIFISETIFLAAKKTKLDSNFFSYYFLILTSLLISVKTLFGMVLQVYGTFYLPFLSLTLLVFFVRISSQKNKTNIYFALNSLLALFVAVFFSYISIVFFFTKDTPIAAPAGIIYTTKDMGNSINELTSFLHNNMSNNDKILVLPEGLFLNYILSKDNVFYNTSFTPLDFEAYGEDYLVDKFIKTKPEYIVLTNRKTDEYGKKRICSDYGEKLCRVIFSSYIPVKTFGDFVNKKAFNMILFRKNEGKIYE